MTETPPENVQQASREATDWLIRLQETPDDPTVLRLFEAWLEKDPVNREAWAITRRTTHLIETALPRDTRRQTGSLAGTGDGTQQNGTSPRWQRKTERQASLRPGSRRGRRLRRAALAVSACLALAVFMPNLLLTIRADHRTGTAEVHDLELPDGTAIALAPDSAIAVRYREEERRVDLLAGEAFFDVAPDPERPFRVWTGEIRASVIGTAFNVLRQDEGATIALQEGRLEVGRPNAEEDARANRLQAGEVATFGQSGEIHRSRRPPALIAAWRNGQLVAEDQPLGQVVDRLRRYYRGRIVITDPGLAELPVTGVYTLADPVEALVGIARPHGAEVRRITPWLLVVSRF